MPAALRTSANLSWDIYKQSSIYILPTSEKVIAIRGALTQATVWLWNPQIRAVLGIVECILRTTVAHAALTQQPSRGIRSVTCSLDSTVFLVSAS